jgi:superfamily II DNA or RNA helicase
VAGVFDGIGLTRPLWPHQVRALAALDRDVARGDRATYLVVPPGGGKTLIGLEAARRLGRPTVVLCPNTAIQAQWMAQWQASFGPDAVPATASRELPTPLTVLTYQALCTLGAAGNGEEAAVRVQGPRPRLSTEGVLSLLHPNGRALIARLQAGGPWTLVLDECHHLLELWGRLLQAVIEQLGQPRIVGLTATPPHLMTAEQAVLHRALFGAVDLEVSAPALVREGLLAPYQELAFLTRPSPAEILAAESAELGSRLRALVLCDFEDAGGMVPADLAGVLRSGSGGARLVLETLLADPQTAALDPVLMTGRHVASGPECAERLLKWLREAEPRLELAMAPWGDLAEITGTAGWEPRRYVPLITRFHAEGGSRCLIGTRALLGEGWDAPAVNVVIDLTAATTPTSVVQARGRALRLDAGWPGKVADNWSVVCVTGDHPKGAADFDRFARKHDRYFALAQTGDVVSGVAHVDPRLSPYAPPPEEQVDTLNATMLRRAGERDGARERWAIGTSFADEPVATVTVATGPP